MAGNNSCGSRSIAYGNMVRNVLGVGGWLSVRRSIRPAANAREPAGGIAEFVHGLVR